MCKAFLLSMLMVLSIGPFYGEIQLRMMTKISAPEVGLKLAAEGFTAPMEFISSGDGTGRMFLVDQIGVIKVILANGTVLKEPFLDISDRMVELDQGYDERGLLGLAFHPDFAKNGRIFVLYSAP